MKSEPGFSTIRDATTAQVDLAGRACLGQAGRANPLRDCVVCRQDLRGFELRAGDRDVGLAVRGLGAYGLARRDSVRACERGADLDRSVAVLVHLTVIDD